MSRASELKPCPARQACSEYARLAGEIRALDRIIRQQCPEESEAEYGHTDDSHRMSCPPVPSCLTEFFSNVAEHQAAHYREDNQHAGRIVLEEMLADEAMCEVCQAKLKAIQARKPLRIKLGAIKRKIERIGRQS